jgi:hypothetical protein
LDQDLQSVAVLIYCTSQIVTFAMNAEKDPIEVPLVARPGPSKPELIRIPLTKLSTPLPNGFAGHRDPTDE